MKMDGGVMKMRQLAGGIEIKPGEAIELSPGGNHLMLLDLKSAIVPGAPVKGELTFEKAGKLSVEFTVAPIGSESPAKPDHTHH
jgi:copper(I)-binding protein